jgi:hypothetical protein
MDDLQEGTQVSTKAWAKSDSGTTGYMQGMTLRAGANIATPAQQADMLQLGARGSMH